MKVLIACEESQRVCIEMRNIGHEAYSCDVQECSGGHPEWHTRQDVLPLLNGDCTFYTEDGNAHTIVGKWDLIIAHPPCTYLTNAGNRHFSTRCNSVEKVKDRWKLRYEAAEFFMKFVNADCDRIAVENPVGYMNSSYRKADQIIHPYYFATDKNDVENYHKKRTCLWLKGLPCLVKTNDLPAPEPMYYCMGDKSFGKPINWCEGLRGTKEERSKARSKTFLGVAKAMATQWAGDARQEEVVF